MLAVLAASLFLQIGSHPVPTVEKSFSARYSFDALKRLRAIRQEDGSTSWTARDLGGRAVATTTTNLLGKGQGVEFFQNDGMHRISASGAASTRRFVYGRSLDELLFQESGADRLSSITTPVGSAQKLVNGSGSIVQQFKYDAFGAPIAGDPKVFSQLFAGAHYNDKAKLYDLRNRHYDPRIGRFLSRDPLGMHTDAANLGNAYAYVGNNPLNHRDPLGLLTGDGKEHDNPSGFALWLRYEKYDLENVGKGLWNSVVGTYNASKFLLTDEIPNLILDAGTATGLISGIGYQSATIQGAQTYYAEAGNSAVGAAGNATKDIGLGIYNAGKNYVTAIITGDTEAAAETLGYALQGWGIAKAGQVISTLRKAAVAEDAAATAAKQAGLAVAANLSEGPATAKFCEEQIRLAGHGSLAKRFLVFPRYQVVPEGTTITFPVKFGYSADAPVLRELGHEIAMWHEISKGTTWTWGEETFKFTPDCIASRSFYPGEVTYLPGARIPDLWLHPPGDLPGYLVGGDVITVQRRTLLSNMLMPNQGHVTWLACCGRKAIEPIEPWVH